MLMNAKTNGRAAVLLLMGTLSTGAGAASISLAPASATAIAGDSVAFALDMDFSDEATFGGGIDFFYDDGLLEFQSFIRNPGLGDEAFARREPDVLPGELNGLSFGHGSGIGGPGLVGTLTFKALAPGLAAITLAENQGGPGNPGPFVSTITFVRQDVTFSGATVTISAVPLPAALPLLLGPGLLLMGSRARRDAVC
jgi:hypothetical protein